MVHPAPEMLHEDEGNARFGSEPAVGKTNSVRLDMFRGCREMGVRHDSLLLVLFLPR